MNRSLRLPPTGSAALPVSNKGSGRVGTLDFLGALCEGAGRTG
ncbi:hypothetical protein [Thioalkalivibrio sp. HK1]|nr:hypothetical protein [Thioalkalivibrio sp. HK1]